MSIKSNLKKLIKNACRKSKPASDEDLIYNCWISSIFGTAMEVPGHILEIGVASGRNSLLFGSLLKLTGESNHRKYYGFDTFEGYALDTIRDNPWLSNKSWKTKDCDLNAVKRRIKQADLSETCTFFKGDCRKQFLVFLKASPITEFKPANHYSACYTSTAMLILLQLTQYRMCTHT